MESLKDGFKMAFTTLLVAIILGIGLGLVTSVIDISVEHHDSTLLP